MTPDEFRKKLHDWESKRNYLPDFITEYIEELEFKLDSFEYNDDEYDDDDDDIKPYHDDSDFDLSEYDYTIKPDKIDGDDTVCDISANPDEAKLTEGTILFNCYLFGKPWFIGTNSLIPREVVGTNIGWYKSFMSTVHKDKKGWFVYPNDDRSREKCYKFGIDSKSRVVREA